MKSTFYLRIKEKSVQNFRAFTVFFFQEDAQDGDQTDLPPPPPEVTQSSSDQQQRRSNMYPETLKRRSMVQSLPSDYSDVQPRSYDPEFISDISNKMQVPDTISMMGHGEKSGSQMGWQEPMQRNEMRVPDRIMVAGWYFAFKGLVNLQKHL